MTPIADVLSSSSMIASPAVVLALIFLAISFPGDGLRDALDPWTER